MSRSKASRSGEGTRRHANAAGRKRRRHSSPAARLFEAERLFRDFQELTPSRFRPLVISFTSFAAYERWRRAQKNPWYR